MSGVQGQQATGVTDIPERHTTDFMAQLDYRFKWPRELRKRLNNLMDDLGGAENLSYQIRSLCERTIFLEFIIQKGEADLLDGKNVDIGKLTQANNSLLGFYKQLGFDKEPEHMRGLLNL